MIRIHYPTVTHARYRNALLIIFSLTAYVFFLYIIGVTDVILTMLFGLFVVFVFWGIMFKTLTA
ncbi:MAG: hypothetical protein ACYCT2_03675 [Thermoplasmataceae archaeon]